LPERLDDMDEEQATNEIIQLMFKSAVHGAESAEAEIFLREGQERHKRGVINKSGPPVISLEHVSTRAEPGECALHDIGFSVMPGEVFGIAGVDGNGQKHLAEVIAGQRPVLSGCIKVSGELTTDADVPARRRLGVRYITDERLGEGTVGGHSVATNLVLKGIGAPPFWRFFVTIWQRIFRHAREIIVAHDVRTPSEHTPLARLSGGNIQKVLLAREISINASVVVFNKPTYGLDIHNTRLARDRIVKAAASGIATIVISTELDELLELSDRIGVIFNGEMSGIVENRAGAESEIGRLMTGAKVA